MWNCQNCGSANADEAAFCVQCGQKREAPRPKKSRKGLVIAIAALLVLALAAAAVFWIVPALQDSSSSSEKSSSRSDKDDKDDEDDGGSSAKSKLLGGKDGEWLLVRKVVYDDDNGQIENTLEYEYGKYGAVSYRSEYHYSYSGATYRYRSSYEYDGKGNRVKSISYDGDTDKPESYTLYEYDRKGNCVKSSTYSCGSDALEQYIVREFDRDGNTLSSLTCNAQDELITRGERTEQGKGYIWESFSVSGGREQLTYHAEYDADDNMTACTSYEDDGTLNYVYSYEYDADGKEIRSSSQHYSNGKLSFHVNTVMEYDGKGNLIREIDTYDDSWDSVTEYSYDEYGNAILEISTVHGRPYTTTKCEYAFFRNGVEEKRSGSVD